MDYKERRKLNIPIARKLTISAMIDKDDQSKLRAVCRALDISVANAIRMGIRKLYSDIKGNKEDQHERPFKNL